MRKVIGLLAAVSLVAASSAAFGASIVNSKHDLTITGATGFASNKKTSQICVYCHAPHGAKTTQPLWNRSVALSTPTFTLYSGVNMASRQFATGFTVDSTSLFCMSCHDGNTSMSNVHNQGSIIRNSASNNAGAPALPLATGPISGVANLGTNLSTTHPVNFPVSTSDPDLNLQGKGGPTGTSMGAGTVLTTYTYPLFKSNVGLGGARQSDRSLECGSCHAVHNADNSPFLRYTMDGSKLCLGCHNK